MKKIENKLESENFILESGEKIKHLKIAYHTFGERKKDSKIIWVCHALTANSDVSDWWNGLFGSNQYFDQEENFVICANIIGSCYGSSGPLDEKESNFLDFPLLTTRDMANAHELLRKELKIQEIDLLIGSSLGGQQAQEFAIILKEKLKNLILIATNAFHSPFGIAFNEAQRLALLADPSFEACEKNGGSIGLKAARSIAMLSYRSYEGYKKTQSETNFHKRDDFKASSYQNYQGQKLANRFNAYSYWYLTKAMDSHNVGRNRISIRDALEDISAKTLLIGISSDLLFPVSEQGFLAQTIPNAKLEIIDSIFGHDGFLVETELLEQIINEFLNKNQA
ncbi:MAG: homoserine O-acetyltransferase [Bacteroidota bacterium]